MDGCSEDCLLECDVVTGLRGTRGAAGGIKFSWDGPLPPTAAYHVNFVDSKADLADPRASAGGVTDCAVSEKACTTSAFDAPGVLFYQAFRAACDAPAVRSFPAPEK